MPSRALQWLMMVCLLALIPTASAASRPAQRRAKPTSVPRNEVAYKSLADWARGGGLQVRTIRAEERFEVMGPSTRIGFTVDSSEAEFNGVNLRLLFPVKLLEGRPAVSLSDLHHTFQPLLSPPQNPPGAKVRQVCLDPGHGGRDPGNQVGANQEKKFTLLLAQEVRQQLQNAGLAVSMTRTMDKTLDLGSQPDIARARGADLFVSLHFNSAPSSARTVHGCEVYCMTPPGAPSSNSRGEGRTSGSYLGNRANDRNVWLAYEIQKSLIRLPQMEDRGLRRARFAVLRDAPMPAVLVEGGYMTHPSEGKKIFDPTYRRELARSIANGILSYKRTVERG